MHNLHGWMHHRLKILGYWMYTSALVRRLTISHNNVQTNMFYLKEIGLKTELLLYLFILIFKVVEPTYCNFKKSL